MNRGDIMAIYYKGKKLCEGNHYNVEVIGAGIEGITVNENNLNIETEYENINLYQQANLFIDEDVHLSINGHVYVDSLNDGIIVTAENLSPENIKEGVKVLNITGTYKGNDSLQVRVDATNNCAYMFYKYSGDNVDYIEGLNTSNVTDMQSMFAQSSKIETIPYLDTTKVGNMNSMFQSCTNLKTIPALNTSNVTNMNYMFAYCTNLETVPALDCSKLGSKSMTDSMFKNCTNLKSILIYGIKYSFDISASTRYETSDLVTILNNLATVTTTQTLTMGETNLAKLNDDQKAIATNKGWQLA